MSVCLVSPLIGETDGHAISTYGGGDEEKIAIARFG
jgi:hypothetical protein